MRRRTVRWHPSWLQCSHRDRPVWIGSAFSFFAPLMCRCGMIGFESGYSQGVLLPPARNMRRNVKYRSAQCQVMRAFIAQQRLRQNWWAASAAARQAARPTPAVAAVHAAAAAAAAASHPNSQRKFWGRTLPSAWSRVAGRMTATACIGNLMWSSPGLGRFLATVQCGFTCYRRSRTGSRKRIEADHQGRGRQRGTGRNRKPLRRLPHRRTGRA
jgi:hypothetical protein